MLSKSVLAARHEDGKQVQARFEELLQGISPPNGLEIVVQTTLPAEPNSKESTDKDPWQAHPKSIKSLNCQAREMIISHHHVPCSNCTGEACLPPPAEQTVTKCYKCSFVLRGPCDWGQAWLKTELVRRYQNCLDRKYTPLQADLEVFGGLANLLRGPLNRQKDYVTLYAAQGRRDVLEAKLRALVTRVKGKQDPNAIKEAASSIMKLFEVSSQSQRSR